MFLKTLISISEEGWHYVLIDPKPSNYLISLIKILIPPCILINDMIMKFIDCHTKTNCQSSMLFRVGRRNNVLSFLN